MVAISVTYTEYELESQKMNSIVSAIECTNLKLGQLGRVLSLHYEDFSCEVGLNGTQYSLLSHVVTHGPMRPVDLAKRMQLDASTLTRNIQRLVAIELLSVGSGPDARSYLVSATSTGHSKQAEAQRVWESAQSVLNERLGFDRVMKLHSLIDSCIECLVGEE